MKQVLFALAAVVLVSLCRGDCTQFCHGQPCPEYTVVEKNERFETRNYVATTWVCTPVDGEDGAHLIEANNRLKAFWDKQKESGVKMPDSWPVLITCKTAEKAVLCWYLPPSFNLTTSDPSITLEYRDATTVFARWFDGQPNPNTVQKNANILKKDLTEDGKTFDSQTSTAAFYESYFSPSHNNEIWCYAK